MNTVLFEVIKQAIKANRNTLCSALETLRNIKNDDSFEDSLKSVLFDLDNTQTNINDILLSLYPRETDVCDVDPETTTMELLEEDA